MSCYVDNFDHNYKAKDLALEPLFYLFPSVSHKYTSKLNLEWRITFNAVLAELKQSKVIHKNSATVVPECSSDFIKWMKNISERRWKHFVIARKKAVKYDGVQLVVTFSAKMNVSHISDAKYVIKLWLRG